MLFIRSFQSAQQIPFQRPVPVFRYRVLVVRNEFHRQRITSGVSGQLSACGWVVQVRVEPTPPRPLPIPGQPGQPLGLGRLDQHGRHPVPQVDCLALGHIVQQRGLHKGRMGVSLLSEGVQDIQAVALIVARHVPEEGLPRRRQVLCDDGVFFLRNPRPQSPEKLPRPMPSEAPLARYVS